VTLEPFSSRKNEISSNFTPLPAIDLLFATKPGTEKLPIPLLDIYQNACFKESKGLVHFLFALVSYAIPISGSPHQRSVTICGRAVQWNFRENVRVAIGAILMQVRMADPT